MTCHKSRIEALALFGESAEIQLNTFRKNPKLELHILQSKTSPSFSETAIDKIRTTFQDLFNLQLETENLQITYNEDLLNIAELFKNKFLALSTKFPALSINFHYVTTGSTASIHEKCPEKVERLIQIVQDYFSRVEVIFNFVGAKELLDKVRYTSGTPLCLTFDEIISSTQGYIGLVRLSNFYNFLTDAETGLRKWLFDSNVRDY